MISHVHHLNFGPVSQLFTWSGYPGLLDRSGLASPIIDRDRHELLYVAPHELAASYFENSIFGISINHLRWIDVA